MQESMCYLAGSHSCLIIALLPSLFFYSEAYLSEFLLDIKTYCQIKNIKTCVAFVSEKAVLMSKKWTEDEKFFRFSNQKFISRKINSLQICQVHILVLYAYLN